MPRLPRKSKAKGTVRPSAPPTSSRSTIAEPKPSPSIPKTKLDRASPRSPRRRYNTRSRPPALKNMSTSAVNTRAKSDYTADSPLGNEAEEIDYEQAAIEFALKPTFKWMDVEVEEVDLSMEDFEPIRTIATIARLPSTVKTKHGQSPLSPLLSRTPSLGEDKISPPKPESMKRKSPSYTQTMQPSIKRHTSGSYLESSHPTTASSSKQKPLTSPTKNPMSPTDKGLLGWLGRSPELDSDMSDHYDSDGENGGWDNFSGGKVFPSTYASFGQDTSLDSHYRSRPLPEGEQPKASLADFIDSIPLEDRAPVGRRRLVKKKDLDDDESDEEVDDSSEISLEQQIESDRKKITFAAKRLGCKKSWVTNTRKEEVIGADDRGEAVASGEVFDSDAEDGGVKKRKGKGLLGAFMDGSDSDDEDMVLRRPGEAPPKKEKGKEKEVNSRQTKAPEPGVNDDMEWINAAELGQRDVNRQFKDVVERKLMWRVPGMITPLLDHQVLGVDWMVDHEMSQKLPRGGLVADAMGLGKTIQSIATMVINPPPERLSETDPAVTLIVAPVALLQQWKEEIEQHAKRGNFSVHIHHGTNKINTVKKLRNQDVVITSYATIMNSYPSTKKPKSGMTKEEEEVWWDYQWEHKRGIFHRVKFWRVILDEAHVIKNRYSRTSLACQELLAMHTWALTGTPIQNNLNDLFPVFRFIRHPHVGTLSQFSAVTTGSERDYQPAAKRIQVILRGCMMRRNKKDMLLGQELIVLPKKRVRMIELEFSEEERSLYQCVEEKSRAVMNKYIQDGTVMENYSQVLVMLMRLRQICDHPYLILQTINKDFTVADLDRALPQDSFAKQSGLHKILAAARLVAMGDTEECSICLDSPEGPAITKCRHVFCRDCITSVITQKAREGKQGFCPLCKREIRIDELAAYDPNADPDEDPDADLYLSATKSKKKKPDEWLDDAGEFMHSAKTTALRDQLLEWRENHPGDKIVLFSQFTKMLDIVEKVMDEEGWGNVRYQGTMNLSDREEALRTFRHDPECWVMLTSLRAGGVGLNLTHANLVLSLDLWWNAAVELQAFDRVHRMGQKKEVFVSRLIVKDTVEQRIMALQEKKQNISNAALGDGAGTQLGKLTQRELIGLFGNIVDGPNGMRLVGNEELGRRQRGEDAGARILG